MDADYIYALAYLLETVARLAPEIRDNAMRFVARQITFPDA